MSTPADMPCRRSALYRWHREHAARFREVDGASFVESYDGRDAPALKLCDLTMLPRTGLRGGTAPQWLAAQIGPVPAVPNSSLCIENGIVARLSAEEFLLLGRADFDATFIRDIERSLHESQPDGIYSLPRADSHCLFALAGEAAPDALAKLCGIDFRPGHFADQRVAQTSMAHVNAVVIRCDLAACLNFFILCDAAYAEYLWDTLLDAAGEFGGGASGVTDVERLSS